DLRTNAAFLHFLLDQLFHATLQVVWKVLNESQNFLDGCSLDDFLDEIIIRFLGVRVDMDFRNTAKKIVNVTQYVLIRADEEDAEIVVFALHQLMQFQRILRSRRRNEAINLAV